jgi:flavin reductase (DIM6/NTAB) family NADH-FMN oxidoreductase RutF
MSVEPRQLRDACGRFGTGVTVITTEANGHEHGMTANAFMSISLDPPLISICIAEKAKMLGMIRTSGRFAVSILAAGQEDVAWHFAGKPRLEPATIFENNDGLPIVRGAVASFVCDVANEIVAGDHVIFLGHVQHLEHEDDAKPLMFFCGRFGGLEHPRPAPEILENIGNELVW